MLDTKSKRRNEHLTESGDLAIGANGGAIARKNGEEALINADEVRAVLKKDITINTFGKVFVGQICSTDNHVVVKNIALDVVNTQNLIPARREELSDQVLRKNRIVKVDLMAMD